MEGLTGKTKTILVKWSFVRVSEYKICQHNHNSVLFKDIHSDDQ